VNFHQVLLTKMFQSRTARPQASADEVAFILDAISDFLQIKVGEVRLRFC
jgi:hypothetical protein